MFRKVCAAPRVEDTAQRYRKPEAHDAQAGWAALRVQSTEDEHAAQQQRSPKPATPPQGVERAANDQASR